MSTWVDLRRAAALLLALALMVPPLAFGGPPQVIKKAACDGNRKGETGAGLVDGAVLAAVTPLADLPPATAKGATTASDDGCGTSTTLAGFTNAAEALVGPAIIATAAIAPIACIAGAVSLMFGGRKGLTMIGSALGALVFVICVKGIVA